LFKLNTGLENFLDELKLNNIALTIATSSSQSIFEFSFHKLKLEKWFDFDKVLFNDGTYPGKPAPDPYLLAAKKIGKEPEECIVIEDAISGIKSAEAAGVGGIIVIGKDEQLKAFGNLDGVVKTAHDFSELKASDFFLTKI
jgi:beta-phosphoglucomutase